MKSTPRFPFQERVSNFVANKSRTGIFVFYGGGKTYLSLKWLEDLLNSGRDVFPCLVLALKSLVPQWAKQITEHSNFTCQMIQGTAAKRLKAFKIPSNIYIANYDFLRSPTILEAADITYKEWTAAGKRRFSYKNKSKSMFKSVIVDESTSLKEARNKRFKSLYALCGEIEHRALLTGKPILEEPDEIFSQLLFLDDGATFGKSYWKFRDTYFTPGPPWRPYAWDLKFGAEKAIADKLNECCICVSKTEIENELPPKIFIPVKFKLPSKTRKVYEQLRKDFEAELPSGKYYETIWATVRAQKMQQLCQGILYTEDGYELFHTIKLDWLRDNIPLMVRESPILIWTNLLRLIPLIQDAISPIPHRTYFGNMKTQDKNKAINDFQTGKVSVLILSQAAGYAGLDLWQAGQAVFVSTDYRADWRENALDRCHRIGSEIHESVTYYDLIMEDSTDEIILEALAGKMKMSNAILKHVRRR
jgi:SNF2 family DNA or RNA helicase